MERNGFPLFKCLENHPIGDDILIQDEIEGAEFFSQCDEAVRIAKLDESERAS